MQLKSTIGAGVLAVGILSGGSLASASEYDPNSLVDNMKALGLDSSFESRSELAKKHSITEYIGSEQQNVELMYTLDLKAIPVTVQKPVSAPAPAPTQQVKIQQQPVKASAQTNGKTITVTATAYTAYCEGCSGITKTGIDLRANPNQKVIAVDPAVIPLGSKVYVEGYGTAIAGDTGGAIKGNKIDVFIPNKSDALEYGRRETQVTILD